MSKVVVIGLTVLALTGCGGGEKEACAGTVTKTFTEYVPGVGINSGGVSIPTGSTKYAIAVKRTDGTYCSKRMKKQDWLAIKEGDTYG